MLWLCTTRLVHTMDAQLWLGTITSQSMRTPGLSIWQSRLATCSIPPAMNAQAKARILHGLGHQVGEIFVVPRMMEVTMWLQAVLLKILCLKGRRCGWMKPRTTMERPSARATLNRSDITVSLFQAIIRLPNANKHAKLNACGRALTSLVLEWQSIAKEGFMWLVATPLREICLARNLTSI